MQVLSFGRVEKSGGGKYLVADATIKSGRNAYRRPRLEKAGGLDWRPDSFDMSAISRFSNFARSFRAPADATSDVSDVHRQGAQ